MPDAALAPSDTVTTPSQEKPRAAVVAWDLSHNPVGRAYVLYRLLEKDYDVDLVGPIWSRYGDALWKPLRNAGLNVRSFRCDSVADFVPKANLLAATRSYDLVVVCKPRLPSMYLGSLLKQCNQCPVILDIDDFELSFFNDESTASLTDLQADLQAALHEPHEELATRYAHTLVDEFDALTVSNIALRDRFGGQILRHARDEKAFTNDPRQRKQARETLGIAEDEFALVFVGTPRPHKGIFEVARALHELNDPSIVFHIVGDIHESPVAGRFEQFPNARVVFHGDCELEELPTLLSAADLVPLIQDPDHAISQYQLPSKISDATALGIPVIATSTPPLADLVLQGAIEVVTHATLKETIRRHAQLRCLNTLENRSFFLNELSFAVNRARLEMAIDLAREKLQKVTDNSAIDDPVTSAPLIGSQLQTMLDQFDSAYQAQRTSQLRNAEEQARTDGNIAAVPDGGNIMALPVPASARLQTAKPKNLASVTSLFIKRIGKAARNILPGTAAVTDDRFDLVFFWKQNDSGIYGRRSDMVTRYLAKSGKIGKVLQFDAPMSTQDIEANFHAPHSSPGSHADQVLINLYDRQLHLRDSDALRARTYLYSDTGCTGLHNGQPIGNHKDYVAYVKAEMSAAGMRPEKTLAWFCPVVWDAPRLVAEIPFAGVISDLIDDQRAWNAPPAHIEKLENSYASTLSASDLVFANCKPLVTAFARYAETIHVVPNGAERLANMPWRPVPERLADLPRPVIGYVGDLSDRIDWMLLQQVVKQWPEASFVLVGPSNDSPNALALAENPNVHMTGVVPYAEVLSYLRAFDVAIVPHFRTRLTEHMNPLKLYNYFAAGLPIVATGISNIDDMKPSLKVAYTAAEFEDMIRAAAQNRVNTQLPAWQHLMDSVAWDTRVNTMLEKLYLTFRCDARESA